MDDRELERAAGLIADSESVMIFGHEWPDGDAIGSVLGLGIALRDAGHRVQASWPNPLELPHKYEFLPGTELLVASSDIKPEGITISVDCATVDRLQELRDVALPSEELINIDHHPDNTRFGTVNLVDPSAAAASEIIYRRAGRFGIEIDRSAALCLYAGLVTDTGRFQFTNTTSATLAAASEIVGMGIDPSQVYENVYQSDSLAYIQMAGEVMTRAIYDEELGLVYGWVAQSDLRKFGVRMNETEDLIDDLRALKGHMVAALFKELKSGAVKVSVRSRYECDIGTIARKLGGGGHRVAAGYTSGKDSVEEAIEELRGEIRASGGSAGCR